MSGFEVERSGSELGLKRRSELIKQIESLQRLYYEIGYDNTNIKTIFSLTLSYLKGQVNKLVVKSFFEVLMSQNKLNLNKEINLLNCFDDLIEELDRNELVATTTKLSTTMQPKYNSVKSINMKEAA